MAGGINELFFKNSLQISRIFIRNKSQRRSLGKPPGLARTLQQRLEELYWKDPNLHYKVNIGYAVKQPSRKEVSTERIEILKKNKANPTLEQLAKDNKLLIPLEEVQEEWTKIVAPYQIKSIAEHYSVYDHLFGDAFFYPVVNLKIDYENNECLVPVYRGNPLKPQELVSPPNVKFDAKDDSLWTLVLTTPDGHESSDKLEYVHWMVGNIQGNDLKKGDTIYNYLQPLPLKGLGYLRYVFILYKQDRKIEFSNIGKESFSGDLNERSFSTYNFYRGHQDYLTPAGLSFFTADFDQSVKSFYNEILKKDCPEYVYDFAPQYLKKQTWFPLKQPFNLYLDRYRDEKEIAQEYLVKKLKNLDPFNENSNKKLKYPNAVPFKPGTPSWLKNEIRKQRLNWGRAKDYE